MNSITLTLLELILHLCLLKSLFYKQMTSSFSQHSRLSDRSVRNTTVAAYCTCSPPVVSEMIKIALIDCMWERWKHAKNIVVVRKVTTWRRFRHSRLKILKMWVVHTYSFTLYVMVSFSFTYLRRINSKWRKPALHHFPTSTSISRTIVRNLVLHRRSAWQS